MLGEKTGREPTRPAAELEDGERVAERGMGDELGRGRVLVEALPVLGPPDPVVDPSGLVGGAGCSSRHDDAMAAPGIPSTYEVLGRVGLPAPVSELAARRWDAVVVGGGHNGLTAAAYLAGAGGRCSSSSGASSSAARARSTGRSPTRVSW